MPHQLVDLLATGTGGEGEVGKPVERTSHISEYILEDTVIAVIVLTGLELHFLKQYDVNVTDVCYLNTLFFVPSDLLG